LLIEPVPAHVEKLKAHRRARVIPVACGSPSQHGKELPIYLDGGRTSLRYSHRPEITVPVMTLDFILLSAGVASIQFLSVDVEGAEIDVLSGLSFDRYRPDLILLEDFADDLSRHQFMRNREYKRVRRTGNNSWYVPNETSFHLSWFGRFQLLRKYYLSLPIRRMKNFVRRERQ
jgi:FkbM family methyltransferase